MQSLPRDIRAAINRMAHAEGQRHAEAAKSRLLADVQRMKAEGADHAALLAAIEGGGGIQTPHPHER